ncbi:MAG: CPBP family intramembrane metalloprotease [Acidimicrobiia bacterium]|nr:CPBP family intramembrane metalloprotease [Acidimicrobiia bacterium]
MRLIRRYPTVSFWVIAFAIAWGIGFTAGVDPEVIADSYSPVAAFLIDRIPKFAITIAGLVVVFGGGVDRKAFMRRLTTWKVPARWYVLALGGPLLAYGVGAWLAPGAKTVSLDAQLVGAALFGAETGLVTYLFTRAGLGEEPGLRGFALARHEQRLSPRRAALLMGGLWGAWHLPVLLDRDVVSVLAFLLSVIALTFVFSWVFHRSGESVLVVALLHSAINAFDDVWETVIPELTTVDWEIPFVAITFVAGIAAAVALKSTVGRADVGMEGNA